MARAGLTRAAVAERAYDIARESGIDRLTVADVARSFAVSVPNIYKHSDGLDGLRRSISIAATGSLTATMTKAAVGKSGSDALLAVDTAYRAFALENPGVYRSTQVVAAAGDAEHEAVSEAAVGLFVSVLSGYRIPKTRMIDVVRTVRSTLHGFVSLEIAGGFGMPRDVGRSFGFALKLIDEALTESASK